MAMRIDYNWFPTRSRKKTLALNTIDSFQKNCQICTYRIQSWVESNSNTLMKPENIVEGGFKYFKLVNTYATMSSIASRGICPESM